jgi:hypothetical protein
MQFDRYIGQTKFTTYQTPIKIIFFDISPHFDENSKNFKVNLIFFEKKRLVRSPIQPSIVTSSPLTLVQWQESATGTTNLATTLVTCLKI